MIRRTGPFLPFLAALAVVPVPGPAARNGLGHRAPKLVFSAEFAGVSKAGDCLWTGHVEGDVTGQVTVALQQVEDPVEAANPVWHVRAHWSVAATRPGRSFSGELEGMVDWKSGVSRLSGVITAGWMKGAWLQQEARVVRGDLTGTLAITSLASR